MFIDVLNDVTTMPNRQPRLSTPYTLFSMHFLVHFLARLITSAELSLRDVFVTPWGRHKG